MKKKYSLHPHILPDVFSTAWHHSPDAIRVIDSNDIVILANNSYCSLMKKPKKKIINEPFYTVYDKRDQRIIRSAVKKRMVESKSAPWTKQKVKMWDGRTLWFLVTHIPLCTAEDKELMITILRNVTEEENSAQTLNNSEQLIRSIADSTPVLIWFSNVHGKCTFFNKTWLEFTGTSLKEELGGGWLNRIHRDDKKSCLKVFLEAVHSQSSFLLEYRLKRADGEYRWIRDHGTPRFLEDGTCAGFTGSCTDFTEKKIQDEQLFASEMRFRTLVEGMKEAVLQVDHRDTILYVNNQFCELSGYSKEELIGVTAYRLLFDKKNTAFIKEKNALRKKKIFDTYILQLKQKNGELRWVSISGAPVINELGKVTGSLGVITDITEKKYSDLLIEKTVSRLKYVNQLMETVTQANNLPEVFEESLTILEHALGANRSSILLFDSNDVMQFIHWHSLSDNYRRHTAGHSPWKKTDSDIHPLQIPDIKKDNSLGHLKKHILKEGIRSLAFVPLMHNNKLLGKFMVYFGMPRVLIDDELQFAQTIAHHVSVAVTNKQAEEKLRNSKEQYASLVQQIPAIVYKWRLTKLGEFVLDYVSPRVKEIYGIDPEILTNNSSLIFRMIHPEDRENFTQENEKSAHTGSSFYWEGRAIIQNEVRWITFQSIPQKQPNGETVWTGMQYDITERKRAEQALQENEIRYRSIVENLNQAYYEADSRGEFMYYNSGLLLISGYAESELRNKTSFRMVCDEHRKDIIAKYKQWKHERRRDASVEFMVQTKSGRKFWVEQTTHFEYDDFGRLVKAANILRDIDERKHAQEALQENEIRYRSIVENLNQAYYESDSRGIFIYCNPGLLIVGEYEESDVLNKNSFRLVCDEHRKMVVAKYKQWKEIHQDNASLEFMVQTKSGRKFWVEQTTHFEYDDFGSLLKETHILRDIDERKKADERLLRSEQYTRSLLNTSPNSTTVTDLKGDILYVNNQALLLYGHSKHDDVLGKNIIEWVPEESSSEVQLRLGELFSGKILRNVIIRLKKVTGITFIAEINASMVSDSENNPTYFIIITTDVTEKIKMEHDLKTSEKRLQRAETVSSTGNWELLLTEKIIHFSDGAKTICGIQGNEFPMTLLRSITLPEFRELLDTALVDLIEHQINNPIEFKIQRVDDGKIIDVYSKAEYDPVKNTVFGIIRDITEFKKTEMAMLQTQKMESIGVLAGGIAHDFNNILQAVLGNASIAFNKIGADHPASQNIRKLEIAAQRAADLTAQMLAYSGKGNFLVSIINLNKVITEHIHFFEVSVPKNVHIDFIPAENLPYIAADSAQMQQVVMNLIINAGESIGKKQGVVHISTYQYHLTAEEIDSWSYSGIVPDPGNYVVLEVRDNGSGMTKETITKIFDPFFTTKFTGRGLGLAAVLGIIRGHSGGLKVESRLNEGTTFRIILPASVKRNADKEKIIKAQPIVYRNVLIIDDEEMVLDIAEEILSLHSIEIFRTNNGEEGIELYKNHQQVISVVLLDLSMPGISGQETFKRLREINPNVKVVLSSGYSEEHALDHFGMQGLCGFIQKPYLPENLYKELLKHLT